MKELDQDGEGAARRFLELITERYDIFEVIVYGSRARGAHRLDSDMNVAVILCGEKQQCLTVRLDMEDLAVVVLFENGISISPIPIWLEDWENPEAHSNPSLLHKIATEGIRL